MNKITTTVIVLMLISYFALPIISLKAGVPTTLTYESTSSFLTNVSNYWRESMPWIQADPNMVLFSVLSIVIALKIGYNRKRTRRQVLESSNGEPDTWKDPVQAPIQTRKVKGWFPPENVCRDFAWWFDYNKSKAAKIICDFYEVSTPSIKVENIAKKGTSGGTVVSILGTYYPSENKITLFRGGITHSTLLHEVFHHLNTLGKAPVSNKIERAADAFAEEVLFRSRNYK